MEKKSKKHNNNRQAALPVGMQVKIYGLTHDDEHSHGGTCVVCFKVWQIVKHYPYFILMQDKHGIRECFTYWELQRRMRPPRRIKTVGKMMGWVWE